MRNKLIFLAILGLFAAACGDSNSNDRRGPDPTAFDDTLTIGPISGFGSVIVNGTEFATNGATVFMDDEPATVDDLRIGMVVTVRSRVYTQTANAYAVQIRFANEALGPISSIDPDDGSFVVLGRTVYVDELTEFEAGTFESLQVGNMVHVSGQWRSQDRIQATHIHRIANAYAAGMTMQVKGEIEDLDVGLQRFRIGTQWADYSAAALELGGNDIANGMFIEASSTAPMAGGDMILDKVQARDRDRDRDQLCDSDCNFELEGFVTDFVSATEFYVDEQPVTTTTETVYINGTVDSLALDAKVAVDGTLDADGVLVADRIVFRLPSLVEIEADIEALDTATESLTLLGINVGTNEFTMYCDHSVAGTMMFGFDDLAVGDRTDVRAYIDTGSVMASKIEREDADDDVTLKSLVEEVSQPSITMLGVMVTADQDTVFQNAAKEVIDADSFFALVEVGSIVKAEGTYNGTSILADTMFLRECEEQCL
jgi:hypothetical protein